jgi:2-polyprenyl-3-methyl-5-hydroxy-6-metoxy-1,4-benzoquinol methylase
MVVDLVAARHRGGGALVDVGCGTGALCGRLRGSFDRCIGVDAVRYEGLDAAVEFVAHDLDRAELPLDTGCAQVVTAVETIEHLENPWAFGRELARIVAVGGWVIITTPNQLSALSKLTLVLKNVFNAFQDGSYPAHRTALLEVDLRRVVAEAGLADVEVRYSGRGRVPFTGVHFPAWVSRVAPRALSDNVAIVARKTGEAR